MKRRREKKKREQGPLERKIATAVAGAVEHHEETQEVIARVAGHGSSWLRRWLDAEQTITLDEMRILVEKTLKIPIAAVLNAPDEAAALDWEVFALMLDLSPDRKSMARDLVQAVLEDALGTRARTESPAQSPRRGRRR